MPWVNVPLAELRSMHRLATTNLAPRQLSSVAWNPPRALQLLRWPLPHLTMADRFVVRALALLARRQVLAVFGLENMYPANDPFIVAINHTTRREALLVPALLVLHRGGRLIHFLADWNFRLIPGVGWVYRRGAITVTRKSARPPVLNLLKPLYTHRMPVLERARRLLAAGRSVGVFPEGTVNPDPLRLLPGRLGAARLSLETGAPVVPVGIRFPNAEPDRPIPGRAPMEVHIGAALYPPRPATGHRGRLQIRAWHATVMGEIGRLSGKSWSPDANGPSTAIRPQPTLEICDEPC